MTQLKNLAILWNSIRIAQFLEQTGRQLPYQNHYIQSVVRIYVKTVPAFRGRIMTIVHGDVRHIVTGLRQRVGLIYLVDWSSFV